jgi:hypothetical protein
MRPLKLDIDVADADADGLADGNSSAGATVTLDGTLASGGTFTSADGFAHQINITDAGAADQSTATYTVSGTDADGLVITESLAGPTSGATVETSNYFLTVTGVAIASAVGGSTVDIGTVDEVSTQTIPLNYRNYEGATHSVKVTGTIDYTVQETLDQIHTLATPSSADWFAISALSAKTADVLAPGNVHVSACRLIVNSYSSGAELQYTVMQNESL